MAKTKTAPKITNPHFEPGRIVGGFGNFEVFSDAEGKLWKLDIEKGHATPVTFGMK